MVSLSHQSVTSRWRLGAFAGAYIIAYVLLDWLSYVQPVLKLGITPWNPQAGLTLAFLIAFGPNRAILTVAAVLLAEILVRGTPAPWPVLLPASLLIALGYAFAAHVLRARGVTGPINTLNQVVWLIGASVAVTLMVSTSYVLLFAATHQLPSSAILSSIARYWVGDLNGILTLTPLLLAMSRWRVGWQEITRRRWEVLAQAAAVALVLLLMFALRETNDLRVFYPLFVPVVWIAFRWGVVGTALCTLTIQIALTIAAEGAEDYTPLIDLQFLLVTLSATGFLLGAVVMERSAGDVRLRERDAALARAMRFASLGEFASALTHELNQPITALVSYLRAVQILTEPLADRDARVKETLDKMAKEAMRTADILRGLRDFYRGGTLRLSAVSVEELAFSVLRSHEERLRRGGVRVRTLFDTDLPTVTCDRTQVEMILQNLLSNAIDAIAENSRANREILATATRSDNGILLAVEDSGPGIAANIATRLFDPFVTTKPDGMGLGLAISRSLLRSQGGELWTERSALGGARFIMKIPTTISVQTAL